MSYPGSSPKPKHGAPGNHPPGGHVERAIWFFVCSFRGTRTLGLVVGNSGLLGGIEFSLMRHRSAMLRHAVGMIWLFSMLLPPTVTFAMCWKAPSIAQDGASLLPMSSTTAIGSAVSVNSSWMDYLLVCTAQIWLLGAVLMFAIQLGGWIVVRRIERQTYIHLSPEWLQKVETLRNALGIKRAVLIRLTRCFFSPFTAYMIRPIIWLPAALMSRLPMDQIEALLAHEMAHIRRLDWLWNGLQCVIESLLFFHPGMWWLSRRIRQEREHPCDDLAVTVCGDAIALAEALTALQQQRQTAPRFALAASGGSLMKRITHLLPEQAGREQWHTPNVVMLFVFAAALLALQIKPPARLMAGLTMRSFAKTSPGSSNRPDEMKFSLLPPSQSLPPSPPSPPSPPAPHSSQSRDAGRSLDSLPPPPSPPSPSSLPLPPKPPSAFESVEIKTPLKGIQGNDRLVALIGTPVSAERDSFDGSIRTWYFRDVHLWGVDKSVSGKAAFSLKFDGPKGRAKAAYEGDAKNGIWQTTKLQITSVVSK